MTNELQILKGGVEMSKRMLYEKDQFIVVSVLF